MVFSNITNTVAGQQSTLSKVAGALKLKAKKPARPRIVVQLPHVAAAAASTPIPTAKSKPKTKAKKSSTSRPRIVVQLPHIIGDAPTPVLSAAERVLQWQAPKRYGDVLVDGILSPKEYLTQHGHYDETGSWRIGKCASPSSSSSSSYDSDDDYIPYIPFPVVPTSLASGNLKRKRSVEEFSRRVKVAQGKAFFDENGAILYNPLEDSDGEYDF